MASEVEQKVFNWMCEVFLADTALWCSPCTHTGWDWYGEWGKGNLSHVCVHFKIGQ